VIAIEFAIIITISDSAAKNLIYIYIYICILESRRSRVLLLTVCIIAPLPWSQLRVYVLRGFE